MPSWMNTELQPCGTTAAARRHQRHGEPVCAACRAAMRREKADRYGYDYLAAQAIDTREKRNGLPEFRPYRWRAAS